MSQEIGFSPEEKAFWQCGTCENAIEHCKCGTKQDLYEIEKLQKIFGSDRFPAEIRYDPRIKKVVIKSPWVEISEEYEMYDLKELGFVISMLKPADIADRKYRLIFNLRRI